MATNKKNIGAFQQAMLSNTKMISTEKQGNKPSGQKKNSVVSKNTDSVINADLILKLEEMGKKYGIQPNILVEKGLDLFISLEDYWFKE